MNFQQCVELAKQSTPENFICINPQVELCRETEVFIGKLSDRPKDWKPLAIVGDVAEMQKAHGTARTMTYYIKPKSISFGYQRDRENAD
ncbi:hypothetical protein TUMEXPCC7403_20260 [Tumidithrix helvetica PCC 7403]|uniref:hypothetical protein n=1 Tax=Tumidithrix helvetica TaxID=3457545 RepID=UPI003CB78FA6